MTFTLDASNPIPIKTRFYYSASIHEFLHDDPNAILGRLAYGNLTQDQINAWHGQIDILQGTLPVRIGNIYFEYSIPRMGSRIDVVLATAGLIFVIEFKVGAKRYNASDLDQVWDYALDLKNFHEASHNLNIVPILVATSAPYTPDTLINEDRDGLLQPICCNGDSLGSVIDLVIERLSTTEIDAEVWERGRYYPTPTIVEAALALYKGHSVAEISRSDAGAINLHQTTAAIKHVIDSAKTSKQKAICFVTGVPGAGKTLVGLNIATSQIERSQDISVFLSGNGPLVKVLQEALARDRIKQALAESRKLKRSTARSEVKAFIQNVHHYRDAYIQDKSAPVDHVALFDEAQRAWNLEKTSDFMKRKKGLPGFNQSEPEFLISCIDRHTDWGVIVCLVGGGQEINTGEAGISEWLDALRRSFPHWQIHISNRLTDSEYAAGNVLHVLQGRSNVTFSPELHLGVSMRSFRAENVSLLVKQLLDLDADGARDTLASISSKYPIVISRDLRAGKAWIEKQARGSERYGVVVSSQAERLKPYAIDVKSPMNPIHWFLAGKDDVRSSYYMEDVATEFHIQGLELDWACVAWDGDFRRSANGWDQNSFRGNRWMKIRKPVRQQYQKNAYRVLLTRARQGMVIVVPHGDMNDPTRHPEFYDPTFEYLREIGFQVI